MKTEEYKYIKECIICKVEIRTNSGRRLLCGSKSCLRERNRQLLYGSNYPSSRFTKRKPFKNIDDLYFYLIHVKGYPPRIILGESEEDVVERFRALPANNRNSCSWAKLGLTVMEIEKVEKSHKYII